MASPGRGPTPLSPTAVASRLRAAGCVFAEDEARLLMEGAATPAQLEEMVEHRVQGFPLEHVLGWSEFCGVRVLVEPGVFVPRGRTEFLVDEAVRGIPAGAVVVDLCCGSGAIGAALQARTAGMDLHCSDLDPAAVRCARRNVEPAGGRVYEGDLLAPLPRSLRGRVDVLVVNAPYVPTAEIATLPREARLHETRLALDGGPDGLDILRRVAAAAPTWLGPAGRVLAETSEAQSPRLAAVFRAAGLQTRVSRSAELEATVVTGSRTA
jgi:release factor glutamine methyltransferase